MEQAHYTFNQQMMKGMSEMSDMIGVSDGYEVLCLECIAKRSDWDLSSFEPFHANSDDQKLDCDHCGVMVQDGHVSPPMRGTKK